MADSVRGHYRPRTLCGPIASAYADRVEPGREGARLTPGTAKDAVTAWTRSYRVLLSGSKTTANRRGRMCLSKGASASVADKTHTTEGSHGEPGGHNLQGSGDKRKLRPHRLRDRIVDLLRQAEGPLTPMQMAVITGETVGTTAYHVRTLREAGVIELVREGRVRGAIAHYYGLASKDQDDRVDDLIFGLLNICGALALPDPQGGNPQATVIDERARSQLLALIEKVKPRVREIAEASTQPRGGPAGTNLRSSQ
jgi:DNA-binding transcriptional ArsR family regulator